MRAFWAIVSRDLRVEGRAREIVPSMAMLGLLLLTVASAAGLPRSAAPPVLWLSITVAVSFGLARSFHGEVEHDQLGAEAMAPVDRGVLYLGKAAANFVTVAVAEVIIVAAFIMLFNVDAAGVLGALVLVVAAGTVGIVAVGTLFGALIAVTRTREALLPLLLLPVAVPAVLGAVRATETVLAGLPASQVLGDLQVLGAFALLSVAVPVVVFEYVLEE
ncbi:MAG TPA: heme exporter protein CcmB [bacterium]|jgi:heme exporter protein B